MATQEARQRAINRAVELVRNDRTGFLSRAKPHPRFIRRVVTYEVLNGPFFYLAGPMTNMEDHNFPEFRRVEAKLIDQGMRIVSPYDLKSQPAPSEGGTPPPSTSRDGLEMLRRDVNIVMDPNCVGIILLEDWEKSFGADVETFVGEAWKRPLYAYSEDDNGGPVLTLIPNRRDAKDAAALSAAARRWFGGSDPLAREAGRLEQRENPLDLDPLGAQRSVRSV